MEQLHVESIGSGPRVVLVHGSITPGWRTWEAQRPLAARYRLVVPHRSGYAPNPPLERIDFERQAAETAGLLKPGDHLVGHSYGGVVAMLAALRRPETVRSLTVIEPPALGMVPGDPVVATASREIELLLASEHDPERLLPAFLRLVGAPVRRGPLSAALEAGVRALMSERSPAEARIPLDELAAAAFPTLVVSSGCHPALEAVCHALATGAGAERAIIPGAGHAVQAAGSTFNDRLVAFIDRAEAAAAAGMQRRAARESIG